MPLDNTLKLFFDCRIYLATLPEQNALLNIWEMLVCEYGDLLQEYSVVFAHIGVQIGLQMHFALYYFIRNATLYY